MIKSLLWSPSKSAVYSYDSSEVLIDFLINTAPVFIIFVS